MNVKHFLSRHVAVNGLVHKLSIVSLKDGALTGVKPFSEETQSVIYVPGVLIVVPDAHATAFESKLACFMHGDEQTLIENMRKWMNSSKNIHVGEGEAVSLYEIDCSRGEWHKIIM